MKRLVLVLLGIVCMCMLAGCGNSDKISGTWVPKQKEGTPISSIVLTKESDFSYQGVINYTDGTSITAKYNYDKVYHYIEEDAADVRRIEKEYKMYGKIILNFNDKYTEAHLGQSVQPEDIFVKQ